MNEREKGICRFQNKNLEKFSPSPNFAILALPPPRLNLSLTNRGGKKLLFSEALVPLDGLTTTKLYSG
jgi:hypothetical protein